jgi:hypothetical protein
MQFSKFALLSITSAIATLSIGLSPAHSQFFPPEEIYPGQFGTPPSDENFQFKILGDLNIGDADRHCKWNEGHHMPSAKAIEFDIDSGTANCRKNNNSSFSVGYPGGINLGGEADNYEEGVSFQRLCQGKYYNNAAWDTINWDWQRRTCTSVSW